MSTSRCGVTLKFNKKELGVGEDGEKDLREGLSAATTTGQFLWLANDESLRLERLGRQDDGDFGEHRTFDLADYLDLPAPPPGATDGGKKGDGGKTEEKHEFAEADLEGLEYEGGYLWLVGSHSLKRKKPKEGKSVEKNLERLATVTADGNRYLLARIPLVVRDGAPEPAAESLHPETGAPLTAQRLEGDTEGNLLIEALCKDPHLGRYLVALPVASEPEEESPGIPGKDNGFDIEGLAVRKDRVFLGLRGPVLRGWAIVLELQVEDAGPTRLKLKPFEDGTLIRRHFLDLGGLGIRDLLLDGEDMLVLAGPTMDLDGPVWIWRWREATQQTGDTLTWRKDLSPVWRIPNGDGTDHAEGVALVTNDDGSRQLLVTYDSPEPARLGKEGEYHADLFEL